MIFKITPAKYNTFGDFYLPGLLGGALGLPWGWLGALLGPPGAPWRLFGVPVGPSGEVCRVPNGFWGPLVAHLAAVLWPLVVSRGALGSPGPGDGLGLLWILLEPFGASLGLPGAAWLFSGIPVGLSGEVSRFPNGFQGYFSLYSKIALPGFVLSRNRDV